MKALIFNSGIGKRMGQLTANGPKCLVHLYNGESIFERQIRLLQDAGIKEVIITTGPYPEMLKNITNKKCFGNMHFTFVQNELFTSTNYIYSFYKARDYINDDFIVMHGDLVFDYTLLPKLLEDKNPNLGLVNFNEKLPEKDFKARVSRHKIVEVGINIFDSNCYAFQPIYKLDKDTITKWLNNVINYVQKQNTNVYAENALNEIAHELAIKPYSYESHFVSEIDNPEDLNRVSTEIEKYDAMFQMEYVVEDIIPTINSILDRINAKKPFIVIAEPLRSIIDKKINVVIFTSFTPNPKYEEVLNAIKQFKLNQCDALISIGGGSCIDVTKSVKLYMDDLQEYKFNDIKHICIPTTCGTGSEATRHIVYYKNDVKQSIANSSILPDYVIHCSKLIESVPLYVKQSTCLDAYCQCIESYWANNSNDISKSYAKEGIKLFKHCYKSYFKNSSKGIKNMQRVAYYSGKAINISATTAAHAMSYKITSMFGIPHGHAVAICLFNLIKYLNDKKEYSPILVDKLKASGTSVAEIEKILNHILSGMPCNLKTTDAQNALNTLVDSINKERLSNFFIPLSKEDITNIYRKII